MVIDKGERGVRTARGMFVGMLALACNACGGGDSQHQAASRGKTSAGGRTSLGGAANLGGSKSSGGRVGSGGDDTAGGVANGGNTLSAGRTSGEGGNADVIGMAGDGGGDPGGTSAGGASAGGTNAGGTLATSGTNSGGANLGGTNSGGANLGGTSAGAMSLGGASAGGASSGGTNFGGTNAGGMNATGGTNSGGTTGGTTAGGIGGESSGGGVHSGGMSSGGAPGTCGDEVLATSEQCDDGNTQNLDGCSAGCRYEVVDRMTSISLQGVSAPAFCSPTTNTLGRAFSSAALAPINTQLQQSLSDGALNNLLQFDGLDDPTGGNDPALKVGFLPAVADVANGAWPGGSPLDFWFRVLSSSVDAQRVPLNSFSGSLTARSLSAGPGLLKLPLTISGVPSTLSMSNARLGASLDATPAPNVPAPPPSNLAPGLAVFQSITGSGSGQGICGNVTVESLAHIPVPPSLASGASTACLSCTGSHTYAACAGNSVEPGCNSLLDVLVGGCKTAFCFVTLVTPVQPDVPAAGSVSVRPLSLSSGNAVPSEQSIGNDDAYSSYFKFDANRAHITGLR